MSGQENPSLPNFTPAEIVATLAGLMLSIALASLDQTIVASSLSTMARDLDGWELMPWVVTAYLITSTTTTPIYGKLSDLYGRRPVMLASIGLFVVTSILCALAQTMPQLIAARALQGLGGGGLRAVTQAVIADIVPPRERGRYQGIFAGVYAVSTTLGPVLGGLFSDYLSWHWIFWINVPLGLLAFLLSNRQLKRLPKPTKRPLIDWWGALLILASSTPILLGIGQVEQAGGWGTPEVIVPILLGFLFLGGLIMRERVAPEPMLPLRLFTNSVYRAAITVTFLTFMISAALIVIIPIHYQLAGGFSAKDAGLRLIPFTGGLAIGAFSAGQLITIIGRYRLFPIVGTGCSMTCCLILAWMGLGNSLTSDIFATLLLGMSFGLQISPITVTCQNALDWRDTGIGMAMMMFVRLIAGAFGVALLSTVLIVAMNDGALAVPGHEVLGAHPGIALFRLEAHNNLSPALLAGLKAAIEQGFSRLYLVAAGISALCFIGALSIKEIPLKERGPAAAPVAAADGD